MLADGLCHKGREYLATNAKELERYGSSFDAALDEARRCLGPSGETIESFKPLDTEDNEGALAATGKRLRERAAELTRVVAEDIVHGLDLTNGKVQQEVAGAISGALEDVELGLSGLPTWKRLTELANAFSDEKIVVLEQAIETAQTDFVEALNLAERGKCDTRLQLKALGARWHEAHRRQKEVNDCPLCDQPLTDPAMAAELESLRHCAEAVTRRLEDNLNAILAQLDGALAQTVTLGDAAVFAPRQKLLEDISQRFVERDRYRAHLACFTKLISEALAHAPFPELGVEHVAIGRNLNVDDAVKARIGIARGVLSLVQWFNENAENWRTWWDVAARGITPPQPNAMETGIERARSTKESLVQHLTRLSDATAVAAPYRGAAEALSRAWKHGREARRFEKGAGAPRGNCGGPNPAKGARPPCGSAGSLSDWGAFGRYLQYHGPNSLSVARQPVVFL